MGLEDQIYPLTTNKKAYIEKAYEAHSASFLGIKLKKIHAKDQGLLMVAVQPHFLI